MADLNWPDDSIQPVPIRPVDQPLDPGREAAGTARDLGFETVPLDTTPQFSLGEKFRLARWGIARDARIVTFALRLYQIISSNTMESKAWYLSKTVWFNVLTFVWQFAGPKVGMPTMDGQTFAAVVTVANLILRFVTKSPVSIS